MKAINLFLFVAVMALGGCDMISKKTDQGDAAAVDSLAQHENAAIQTSPAKYVQFFDQAILTFEQGDQASTLAHLQSGINVLIEDSKALEDEAKKKIDTAIADLEAAKLQLQQGQILGAADLKQLIFMVQTNTPHQLLADAPVGRVIVHE